VTYLRITIDEDHGNFKDGNNPKSEPIDDTPRHIL